MLTEPVVVRPRQVDMGRNDWQRQLDHEELSAVGVSRHRGRGWKVVSSLLLVVIVAFSLAYYVPLYRAHTTLTDQYRKLASESKRQREQLTETIETLKLVSAEREKLAEQSRHEHKDQDVVSQRTSKLEENLRGTLKKFLGKGRVELSRQGSVIKATLGTPALLGQGNSDVTVFGKQALCALAGPLKTAGAQVIVLGAATATPPKGEFSFPIAAGRAVNIAKQLIDGCGFDANKLEVRVNQSVKVPTLGAEVQVTFGD